MDKLLAGPHIPHLLWGPLEIGIKGTLEPREHSKPVKP